MAYALSPNTPGALTPSEQAKIAAALARVNESASGRGFGLQNSPVANISPNPGLAMGPTPSMSGPIKSAVGSSLMGLGGGFGFGPMGALGLAKMAVNPSSFADTGMTNIPGLGTIATKPGPFGALTNMTGFGSIVNSMGALNAANLNRIAATDPNAMAVKGPGFAGFVHEGVYSGNTPSGLTGMEREAWKREVTRQAQAQRGGGGRGADAGGRNSSAGERDPRAHEGGGRRV